MTGRQQTRRQGQMRRQAAACDRANGVTEWGGAGATVACDAAAAGRSGVLNGVVTRYDRAAMNEAGAEYPLPICGHCMFTMMMCVNGHGFLANLELRVVPIS